MNRIALFLFVSLATCVNFVFAIESNPYVNLYNQIAEMKADENRVAQVSNLRLVRDVAEFNLQDGKLYFIQSVNKRIVSAFFTGKGVVNCTPPTKVEREQLARFTKSEKLSYSFNDLFFIFSDSTFSELNSRLEFAAEKFPRDLKDRFEKSFEPIFDKDGKKIHSSLAYDLLNNSSTSFFWASFKGAGSDRMYFSIDPYEEEEVRILYDAQYMHVSAFLRSEVICQFHKQADYHAHYDIHKDDKDLVKISDYKLDVNISNNYNFKADCELSFQSKQADKSWIPFYLYHELKVDSVLDENGDKLFAFTEKDNPFVWVRMDKPLVPGEQKKLRLNYHGDLLDVDNDGWVYIKSSIGWYPRQGTRNTANFEITFHYDKKYDLVSVGKNTRFKKVKNKIHSTWITNRPIRNASFNLGFFKKREVKHDNIPETTIYMNDNGHLGVALELSKLGITSGRNMDKEVAADVANSLNFFEMTFGKPLAKRFNATEIPYFHGEAFPGLIHLSWWTFQRSNEYGYSEIFRAHEVAHQWWGIGVDFDTYHDQWLSEGFATFCGLWYMQTVLQDNKKYFNVLKKWKEEILENRKYTFGSGQAAGPIWLGYRNQTSQTQNDFDVIVYKKGAWVLHMLRNLMMNIQTMDETHFENMLKDFYQTYLGKRANTSDFQKIVEKHVGTKMDWFFDQWVYGTEIPEYEFSYKIVPKADNKCSAICRIKQKNVSPDFAVFMPLRVNFDKERFARLRYPVKGQIYDFEIPLPMEPESITINEFESVLGKVDYKKWKD